MMKKQKNGGQTTNELVNYFELLPKPLCQEIFVRIPARDIMNGKRVCKPWYEILREPSFAILYSKKSPFSTVMVRVATFTIFARQVSTVLVRSSKKCNQVWYMVEFSNNGDFICTPFKPTIPDSLIENSKFNISSSCNGFLCLTVHTLALDIVCISNPVLGECFVLPQHENYQREDRSKYILGFVPSMNRFKVVRIAFDRLDEIKKCEIITIGVDATWRVFEDVFTTYLYWDTMLCLYGVLHWIPNVDSPCGVYTFDLEEEKLGQILNPPGVVVNWRTMTLELCSNQLYLVDKSDKTQIIIWTMQESWTKDVVMESWFPSGVDGNYLDIVLVGKSRNGDMYFIASACLDKKRTFYKVKDGKCYEIGVLHVNSPVGSLELYEPNFLSLKEFMVKGTQD